MVGEWSKMSRLSTVTTVNLYNSELEAEWFDRYSLNGPHNSALICTIPHESAP